MAEQNLDTYAYTALDKNQKMVKSSIQAVSKQRAYQNLKAQGLTPIDLTYKADTMMNKDIQIPGLEKKAKLKALVIFTKQFALLIQSGMPLIEAINISQTQTEDMVLKMALKEVSNDVERGATLSGSMEKHPAAFPGLLTAVVKVGEEGGFLDYSMKSMAKTYQTELELKQRIKSAMTYPLIVVGLAGAILIGMMIFVVPMFAEMFESLDAELPVATQILVVISENSAVILPIVAVLIILAIIFFKYFAKEIWMRKFVDNIALKAPVFGVMNTKTAIARFCRNLSMMLSAGVPLTTALRLVSSTSDNYYIEAAVDVAVKRMEAGGTLTQGMKAFDMFPYMVQQMISVGEQSGSLPPMLDSVADFYENETKELSEKLSASLEPIMLVVLGVLVGGMLFALYLPMFSLFNKISEG